MSRGQKTIVGSGAALRASVGSGTALRASVERRCATQWNGAARLSGKTHSPLPTSHSPLTSKGFTLIELIMTMVIVGILAVFVAPRFSGSDVFKAHGAANQVKAALRYGQKVAVAQRTPVSVEISQAGSSDCGTALTDGDVSCSIPSSVAATGLPKTVTFDALGRPNAADSFTVGTRTITIEAETGYVHE